MWQFLQLVPTHIEIAIRRLKEYQSWSREPEHHRQEIAAVFGRLSWEERGVDAYGRLTRHANPWASQLNKDLELMATLECWSECAREWR